MGGPLEIVGGLVSGAKEIASDPVGSVAGVFDVGEPSGNNGGSSNWAAWGHEEIRAMLDNTVLPDAIDERVQLWRHLQERAADLLFRSTAELRAIVSDGWRGEAAEAAIHSLEPVDEWATTVVAAMDHTARLMDYSGSAAGQAKVAVPQAVSHDWGRSLGSFGLGGPLGAVVDAVAQDQAQQAARAEAVRIMTYAYSAPINESRAAVPVYPQLADPTLRPPEPALSSGPSAGAGYGGPGALGAGGSGPGGGVPTQPPAVAGLQGVAGPLRPGDGAWPRQGHPGGPRQPVGLGGGGTGGAIPGAGLGAAGVPLMTPMGGAGVGSDADRARRGFRGAGFGGGRPGDLGGRAGGGPGFGPRGSAGSVPGAVPGAAEGRLGAGPGAGGVAGRGGMGAAPLVGAGAGRGQGGEDTEHRRPSYLIEMDDIFGDGRKVAPPVIGEDPPEYYR